VLRALVWDVDGTLAETEHDGHRVAFNRAFAEAGLRWHWDTETYRRLLATTGGKERITRWWHEVQPHDAEAPDAPSIVRALHARKTTHYERLVQQGAVVLRPGVRRLLVDARRQGLVLAIATTTTAANVDALLDATLGRAAHAWFAVVGAGDAVPAKKPAPDIYQHVLRALALPASDCLALEDSAAGVAAATAAGVPVLLTRSRYTRHEPMAVAVLGDIDGFGEPNAPAQGQVRGAPWRGVLDLATLKRWHAAGAHSAPQTA
jgi:HAD superfamily hydrolase (TIGR01509 family)